MMTLALVPGTCPVLQFMGEFQAPPEGPTQKGESPTPKRQAKGAASGFFAKSVISVDNVAR